MQSKILVARFESLAGLKRDLEKGVDTCVQLDEASLGLVSQLLSKDSGASPKENVLWIHSGLVGFDHIFVCFGDHTNWKELFALSGKPEILYWLGNFSQAELAKPAAQGVKCQVFEELQNL